MNHLTDEQLIEHYFGDGVNRVVAETHLRICARCEQVYEEICNSLAVRPPEPPARPAGYVQGVWRSIQSQVTPYPARPRRRLFSMPRLVLATACMLGLASTFIAGTLWERSRAHSSIAGKPTEAKERVVLLILEDHLDRSERLLVQLHHAGADTVDPGLLQAEARQLLPDNRLYRQTLAGRSDPIMTAALDHLERVLLEVANAPDRLSNDDIARIEKEMNTDSLLFQIRVLQAKASQPEPKVESFRKGSI